MLVAELDAFGEGDGADLIEADGEPGVAAAHQKAVDAGGVDERNHGGVLDPADAAALEVEHRHGQQFREVTGVVRHRKRPSARQMRAPRLGRQFDSGTDALYTAFLTLVLIWRIGLRGRNKKVQVWGNQGVRPGRETLRA